MDIVLIFIRFFFFCRVTVPGYQGNLQAAISDNSALAALVVEFTLTFVIVLAYFMSIQSYKSYFGSTSLSIGAAYTACSFVSVSINSLLLFSINFKKC